MADETEQDETLEETGNEQETELEDEPEATPSGDGEEKYSTDESQEDDKIDTESTKSLTDLCTDFLYTIYSSRYYRQILKSVLVFALALKMAQESKTMVIPIREYEPFTKRF